MVLSPDYEQFDQVTKALNKDTVELFCGFPNYLEYANNLQDLGNNGIMVGKNSYDPETKTASVEWTREFDVKAPNTITLMSNLDFRIWLQWGTYKEADDPTDAGPAKTIGNKDITKPTEFKIPKPPVGYLDSQGAWIKGFGALALASVSLSLY